MPARPLLRIALLGALVAAPALAGEVTIGQKGQKFSEESVSLKTGDTVKFMNDDNISHNVLSKGPGGNKNAGLQKAGDTTASGLAKSLLDGTIAPLMLGSDTDAVSGLVTAAMRAQGEDTREIFGARRRIDWSQFEPRGHYADSADLHASASWHQLGLTGAGDDGFAVPWRIDRLPAGARPIVAAAACLGGDGPTGVIDLRTLRADGTTAPATAAPAAAARTACLYPVAK